MTLFTSSYCTFATCGINNYRKEFIEFLPQYSARDSFCEPSEGAFLTFHFFQPLIFVCEDGKLCHLQKGQCMNK